MTQTNRYRRRLNRLALATLVSSVAPVGLAQSSPPLEFKGVPIGTSEAQMVEKYPVFECADKGGAAGRTCYFSTLYASKIVPAACRPPDGKLGPADCARATEELSDLGATKPKSYMAIIRNEKVAQVFISFPVRDFTGVVAAFIEKYGKPSTDAPSTVKNRMGAEFNNRVVEWTRIDGTLQLEQRGSDIETSRILITAPFFATELRKSNEESAKAAAKKL